MDLIECRDIGARPVDEEEGQTEGEPPQEEEEGDSDEDNAVWQDEWPTDVKREEDLWAVTTSSLPLEVTQQEWEYTFAGPEYEGRIRQSGEPYRYRRYKGIAAVAFREEQAARKYRLTGTYGPYRIVYISATGAKLAILRAPITSALEQAPITILQIRGLGALDKSWNAQISEHFEKEEGVKVHKIDYKEGRVLITFPNEEAAKRHIMTYKPWGNRHYTTHRVEDTEWQEYDKEEDAQIRVGEGGDMGEQSPREENGGWGPEEMGEGGIQTPDRPDVEEWNQQSESGEGEREDDEASNCTEPPPEGTVWDTEQVRRGRLLLHTWVLEWRRQVLKLRAPRPEKAANNQEGVPERQDGRGEDGGNECFGAETSIPIWEDGWVTIAEATPGDRVRIGKNGYAEIAKVIYKEHRGLGWKLKQRNQKAVVTGNHPIKDTGGCWTTPEETYRRQGLGSDWMPSVEIDRVYMIIVRPEMQFAGSGIKWGEYELGIWGSSLVGHNTRYGKGIGQVWEEEEAWEKAGWSTQTPKRGEFGKEKDNTEGSWNSESPKGPQDMRPGTTLQTEKNKARTDQIDDRRGGTCRKPLGKKVHNINQQEGCILAGSEVLRKTGYLERKALQRWTQAPIEQLTKGDIVTMNHEEQIVGEVYVSDTPKGTVVM